jgi:hypothetical protein
MSKKGNILYDKGVNQKSKTGGYLPMQGYTESRRESVVWPEPMESIFQWLPRGPASEVTPKLPHLSLSDVLFIGAVSTLPREERPWGAITWLSEVFALSRVSVYALGQRLQERLGVGSERPVAEGADSRAKPEPGAAARANVLERTVLTATFPGDVSIRGTQAILGEALGESRSVGWLSELRLAAGRQAGQVLEQIDTSALGPLIVIRDETFFQGEPILLVVDPVSLTILLVQACDDRQADTWGVALLMAQARGAKIVGLVEDLARPYPKSQRVVEMEEVAVQKDPWHLQREGSWVRLRLEKAAYRAMTTVLKLEKQLGKAWDETLFLHAYLPAVAQEERLIAQHDSFAEGLAHLHDAFELVDRRSGEIRDPATAAWLLSETLTALRQIEQPTVQAFVKTVTNHQAQLLTFLEWTAAALLSLRSTLADQFPQPASQHCFERTVARHWCLRQALINGHRHCQRDARQAQADFDALLQTAPACHSLAQRLLAILDGAGHTSSLVESINSQLKRFLTSRQAFRNQQTLQAYLDLFVLWHNMRIFQRGKRSGRSPYQIAGIDPGSSDWLALLGFPAA